MYKQKYNLRDRHYVTFYYILFPKNGFLMRQKWNGLSWQEKCREMRRIVARGKTIIIIYCVKK